MLETVERETGPSPRRAVIWLHGLGADGYDFVPIVPELCRSTWPPLRFVFPHAPIRPVTLNAGMPMRAWYDIAAIDLDAPEDEAGMRQSISEVGALVRRELERGITPTRILLGGFSQGAAIALAAGLRLDPAPAGIIALSGYLPLRTSLARELSPSAVRTPIFIAHGRYDPIVPLPLGRLSSDFLRHCGIATQWREYPIEHSVAAEEIDDLAEWIESIGFPHG
jgi:phospholipase/carboxylesterase